MVVPIWKLVKKRGHYKRELSMNLNIKATAENTYDAIVVGTGISGGWAAKELCEKGLKTLVLDRGRDVKHVEDYPTMHKHPWELPNNDRLSQEELKHYQKQNRTGYYHSSKYQTLVGKG